MIKMLRLPLMSVESGIGSREKSKQRRGKSSAAWALLVSFTLLIALTQGAPANNAASEPIQQGYEKQTTTETVPNSAEAQNSASKSKKTLESFTSDLVTPFLDGQSFADHPKAWVSNMSGTKHDQKLTQLNYSQWRRIQRRLQSYNIDYSGVPGDETDFNNGSARNACSDAVLQNGGFYYEVTFYECVCYVAYNTYGDDSDLFTNNCVGVTVDPFNDGYQITNCDILLNADLYVNQYDISEYERCYCLNRMGTQTTYLSENDQMSICNGEDLTGITVYEWTNLYSKGGTKAVNNVPFWSDGYCRCDLCQWNKNPCTYFASDGSQPVAYKDCDGNVCSGFDKCETIWSAVFPNTMNPAEIQSLTTYSAWDVVDLQGNLCPWAEMTDYSYKTTIPTTISALDNDCYNYQKQERAILIEDGFTGKNFYWLNQHMYDNWEEIFNYPYDDTVAQQMPWQDYAKSREWYGDNLFGDGQHFYNCVRWNEEIYKMKYDWGREVCNAYGDTDRINCALCQPNLLRIFYNINWEYDATSGSDLEAIGVYCGSVRNAERDGTTHAYTYMDPTTVTQDQLASGTYQCYIHWHYINNPFDSDVYAYINTKTYYPTKYTNKTDGFEETLCVNFDDWIDTSTCSQTGVTPTASYVSGLTADTDAVQSSVISLSIGCNYCADNFIPHIIYNEVFGLFIQECQSKDTYDYTTDDVPCATLGYIQQWTGYIISEQVLTCQPCSGIVPNCLVCTNKSSCQMCDIGYEQSSVYDDDGVANQVCLKSFCGLEGYGPTCLYMNETALEYCWKADTINAYGQYLIDRCLTCIAGYYDYYFWFFSNDAGYLDFLRKCSPQENSITKDFFVRPELSDFFSNSDSYITKMYEQLMNNGRGERWEDPFYFLQQVLSLPADGMKLAFDIYDYNVIQNLGDDQNQNWYIEYEKYQNVTFNVWMFKGTHHFVSCLEYFGQKYAVWPGDGTVNVWDDQLVTTLDSTTDGFATLCKTFQAYYPVRKNNQNHDTFKFYFRPLECKLKKDYFLNMEQFGSEEVFDENCVDLEAGDSKPQIRVHGRSLFNVTNFMQFENLEFTGEDNLVHFDTDLFTDSSIAQLQDLFDASPFSFCKFNEETNSFIHTASPEIGEWMSTAYNYTCLSDFNATTMGVELEEDQACTETFSTTPAGVRACQGEPFHSEFFEKSPYNYFFDFINYLPTTFHYVKRHKVLFNLYSFDVLHSNLTHSPTLNIYNCDFKYFLDKQALIQIETNNYVEMAVEFNLQGTQEQDTTVISQQFLVHLGEDRGGRIDIDGSTFKHSKFCKGMISYRSTQRIAFTDEPKYVKFMSQKNRTEANGFDDGRAESFIRIKNSQFENLAYQQLLTVLSNLKVTNTVNCGSGTTDFLACVFEPYDHRGFVLNVKGFPGSIQIEQSNFKNNMAYIKDYHLKENKASDTYLTPTTIAYSQFEEQSGQLNFKVCDSQYVGQYLVQSMADPFTEFNDKDFVQQYESVSTLMIMANKGPLIIKNNTFEENIGTLGGAIHIMSPDFESNADSTEANSHPYIYIENNTFSKNMAYFAGNAIYMGHTKKRITNFVDHLYVCGAGVSIDNNIFEGNVGLKKHNGGAILHRCLTFEATTDTWVSTGQTSSYMLASREKEPDDPDKVIYFYDNPATTTDTITDLYNSTNTYTLLKYATKISNNNFTKNYAGMKGSAIVMDEISEIQISNNTFKENGPTTSFAEAEFSPYYKYFALSQKLLTFNKGDCSTSKSIVSEFDYIERCFNQLYSIDLPPLFGTIYVHHCNDVVGCYFPVGSGYLVEQLGLGRDQQEVVNEVLTFQAQTNVPRSHQRLEISNNLFDNNQVFPVMTEKQAMQQSAGIYIIQGRNILLNNTFSGHRNIFDSAIEQYAPKTYAFMPAHYFQVATATLVYIYYDDAIDDLPDFSFMNTLIKGNNIIDNQHVQNYLLAGQQYKYTGSLIEFISPLPLVYIQIEENDVQSNLFLGEATSLIHIDGGIMKIKNNNLQNNGYLSRLSVSNHPDSVELEEGQVFPFSQYIFEVKQDYGVFGFAFTRHPVPVGEFHEISGNRFKHIFCKRGCGYYAYGDEFQQMLFIDNNYQFMFSVGGGSVFYGAYSLQPSTTEMFIQIFDQQTIENTSGGAIVTTLMNNAGLTIVQNCAFYNNFGTTGGAIRLTEGGGLFAYNNTFSMLEDYQQIGIPDSFNELMKAKADLEGEVFVPIEFKGAAPSLAYTMIFSYKGTVDLSTFIADDSIVLIDRIVNKEGQVYVIDSATSVEDFLFYPFYPYGITFIELIRTVSDYDVELPGGSVMQDNIFKNLFGEKSSAISVYNSRMVIRSQVNEDDSDDDRRLSDDRKLSSQTKQNIHFQNNISSIGTTIYGFQSIILMTDIQMDSNLSAKGGCFEIVNSELLARDNYFTRNVALQGGVIFAIQRALFEIRTSIFQNNMADDGGVVYAMSNQVSATTVVQFVPLREGDTDRLLPSLRLYSSTINENWSRQNLIHILLSSMDIKDCRMADNYAQFVTHGITLISSQLWVSATNIMFTDLGRQKIDALVLDKLDTGFFNLYLGSEIHIQDRTVVQQLTAAKQSVLSAISQSSIYTKNDVRFINNTAEDENGFTMLFINTKDIEISDSAFDGNQQINLMVQLGNIVVNNSTFTDGKKQHIYATQTHVVIDKVKMFDSIDEESVGHGVFCDGCLSLLIKDTIFQNMIADEAPGLWIMNQMGIETIIQNCTFQENIARKVGGGIRLRESGTVHIQKSKFIGNQVTGPDRDWRYRDAGAIHFRCDPTVTQGKCETILDDNLFDRNFAENKGGALRYVNTNFTSGYRHNVHGGRILSDRALQADDATDSNSYQNNDAAYGADFASIPSSYTYVFIQNGKEYSSDESDQVIFAPGQELVLKVMIYDNEGRLYADENDAVANIIFSQNQDLKEGSVIINPESVAVDGIITWATLNIRQVPQTNASMNFRFSNMQYFNNKIESFQKPVKITVSARGCEEGESYGEALTCLPCEAGFRLYAEQDEPGSCEPCLEIESCYGSNSTAPIDSFWRSSPTSINYIECYNPKACLAGDEATPLGKCAEGYDGTLCANCVGRYRRNGAFICTECAEASVNIVISSFYLLALVVAVVMLVRSSMRGSNQIKPLSSVYIKIFLNHFQMLQVISKVKFGWPPMIQEILNIQQYIASLPTQVISFDCLMIDYLTGPDPDSRFNYIRLYFFYALPLVVVILSFMFWFTKGCCRNPKLLLDKTVSCISIIWFLFYPTIVQYLAASVNCTDIEGVKRLYNDLEQICFEGQHMQVVYTVSIPGIILWAFGVPFLAFFMLKRFLKQMSDVEFHSDPTIYNELQARFKLRLGFLTQGYHEEFYYWEVIQLLRKAILVLMLTFLAPISSGVQSLTAILILIVSLILHIKKQPFYDDKLNTLESMSLFVMIFIIYFGLYYQAGKKDPFVQGDGTMWCIFLLILLISIFFITLFIVRMRMEILKATVAKYPCFFKMFSCGRIKDRKRFMAEHKIGVLLADEVMLNRDQDSEKKMVSPDGDVQFGVTDPKDIKLHVDKLADEDMSDYSGDVSNRTPRSQRNRPEASLLDMFVGLGGKGQVDQGERVSTIWDKPRGHGNSILKKSTAFGAKNASQSHSFTAGNNKNKRIKFQIKKNGSEDSNDDDDEDSEEDEDSQSNGGMMFDVGSNIPSQVSFSAQKVRDVSDRNNALSKQKQQQSEASMESCDVGDLSHMMNPIDEDDDGFSQLGLLPAASEVSARGPQSQQRYGGQQ